MAELTVYGENARLKKRVRELREQVEQWKEENERLLRRLENFSVMEDPLERVDGR